MNIAQIGLILDMFGVLLLFRYGLPSKYKEDSEGIVLGETDIEKRIREKNNFKIKAFAYLGLSLIFLGFLFQFLSYL